MAAQALHHLEHGVGVGAFLRVLATLEIRDPASGAPSLWLVTGDDTDPIMVEAWAAAAGKAARAQESSVESTKPESPSASGRRRRTEQLARERAQKEEEAAPERSWVGVDQIVELACPFAALGISGGNAVAFQVEFRGGNGVNERLPTIDAIRFTAPTEEFEADLWHV